MSTAEFAIREGPQVIEDTAPTPGSEVKRRLILREYISAAWNELKTPTWPLCFGMPTKILEDVPSDILVLMSCLRAHQTVIVPKVVEAGRKRDNAIFGAEGVSQSSEDTSLWKMFCQKARSGQLDPTVLVQVVVLDGIRNGLSSPQLRLAIGETLFISRKIHERTYFVNEYINSISWRTNASRGIRTISQLGVLAIYYLKLFSSKEAMAGGWMEFSADWVA